MIMLIWKLGYLSFESFTNFLPDGWKCAVCSNVELGHGVLCEVGAKTRDADGNRSVLWQSKLAEWIDPDISEHDFRLPMYHFHPFPAAVISMTLTKKKTVACTDPSDPTSKSCGIIGFQDSGVVGWFRRIRLRCWCRSSSHRPSFRDMSSPTTRSRWFGSRSLRGIADMTCWVISCHRITVCNCHTMYRLM